MSKAQDIVTALQRNNIKVSNGNTSMYWDDSKMVWVVIETNTRGKQKVICESGYQHVAIEKLLEE